MVKNDIPYKESDFSKEEKIVSILNGQTAKKRTLVSETEDKTENINADSLNKSENVPEKMEIPHEELENIVRNISGSTMRSLLCGIAKHDAYNILNITGSDMFDDLIYAVNETLKNHDENTSLLKNADFALFDEIIHSIIIDYFMPLVKRYGNVDIKSHLKDIEQIVYFISGALDKYYSEIEDVYNKDNEIKLHTFLGKSEGRIDKIIANGVLWTIYTIDRKNFDSFELPAGMNNAVVRDKTKHILAFVDVNPDNPDCTGYQLPEEFNMYLNSKSPEYQAVMLMLKIIFRNDRAYCDSAENAYKPCYRLFVRNLINSFANADFSQGTVIPDSLCSILKRYISGFETEENPEFDNIALSVVSMFFESISDEDFLSGLDDDDCLAEEIISVMADTIREVNLLGVYNSIVDSLIEYMAHLCIASTNTTKAIVSHTLKSIPLFKTDSLTVDVQCDNADKLNRAIEKLKHDKSDNLYKEIF